MFRKNRHFARIVRRHPQGTNHASVAQRNPQSSTPPHSPQQCCPQGNGAAHSTKTLISLGQLCDHGCDYVLLDRHYASIIKDGVITVVALRGPTNSLWLMDLEPSDTPTPLPTQHPTYKHCANSAYEQKTKIVSAHPSLPGRKPSAKISLPPGPASPPTLIGSFYQNPWPRPKVTSKPHRVCAGGQYYRANLLRPNRPFSSHVQQGQPIHYDCLRLRFCRHLGRTSQEPPWPRPKVTSKPHRKTSVPPPKLAQPSRPNSLPQS
jgi:hypothetical protein